jgi:hypothetical protein
MTVISVETLSPEQIGGGRESGSLYITISRRSFASESQPIEAGLAFWPPKRSPRPFYAFPAAALCFFCRLDWGHRTKERTKKVEQNKYI